MLTASMLFILGVTAGLLTGLAAVIVAVQLVTRFSRTGEMVALTPQRSVEQVALPFYMKGDREEQALEQETALRASMARPEVFDNLEGLGK